MPSKRARAKEWKRRKRQRQLILRFSAVAVCLLIVASVGFYFWDIHRRSYVVVFEGQRIDTDELRFFGLFGPQPLDQLTDFLLIQQAARSHDIALSFEELAEVTMEATEMQASLAMFDINLDISDERMVELISMDHLRNRLIEIYTADFTVNEAEFSQELAEFLEDERDNFIEIMFKFVEFQSMAHAYNAWDDLYAADPEDFDEILLRYWEMNMIIDDDFEIPRVFLSSIRTDPDIFFHLDELNQMEPGSFSEPIQVGQPEDLGYIILVAEAREVPSDDEIGAQFREFYERGQRSVLFQEVVNGWRETADIQINQRGIDAA